MKRLSIILLVAALGMWGAALAIGLYATSPVGLVGLLGVAGVGLFFLAVFRAARRPADPTVQDEAEKTDRQ